MNTATCVSASREDAGGGTRQTTGQTYRAGEIYYTRRQLMRVFFWLLGGDFAFTFFEQIFGRFIPLFAKDLHGSNMLIGIMTGSIAGLMNVFFLPNISMRSDRHRGPLGRRIPLLLWATPCTVGSLLLVGYAPEIGHVLTVWTPRWLSVGETSLTLGLLCLFVVSYHLWNMVLVNAYNWLIRDVVPTEVIGRFLSWFRLVTTLASFIFLWWVFPQVISHRKEVFVIVGLTYALIFLGMCWQIREGSYPPPPQEHRSAVASFLQYFRECLSVAMYRQFFLVYVLMVAATISVNPFLTLFARNGLGLEMGGIGRIFAWGTLASAIAFLPVGWLCDKFNPIRVVIAGIVGYALALMLAYFFVHDRTSWWIYTILSAVPLCAWSLGNATLSIALFPAEKFGQFSAGLNVFGYGGIILGNYLLGTFMDWVHSSYQLAFVWGALMSALAIGPMLLVYRGWKRHGGPDEYVPPLPEVKTTLGVTVATGSL
jgi:maltose/moltooligosaccharide transporter